MNIEEEIKPPYVFNKYDQEIVTPDEIKDMTIVNDFMKDHSWASKDQLLLDTKELLWKVGELLHISDTSNE